METLAHTFTIQIRWRSVRASFRLAHARTVTCVTCHTSSPRTASQHVTTLRAGTAPTTHVGMHISESIQRRQFVAHSQHWGIARKARIAPTNMFTSARTLTRMERVPIPSASYRTLSVRGKCELLQLPQLSLHRRSNRQLPIRVMFLLTLSL